MNDFFDSLAHHQKEAWACAAFILLCCWLVRR